MGYRATAIAAVITLVSPVWAEGDSETVRLSYSGLGGCPAESAFVAEVRARTKKARFSGDADGRRFRVDLERAGDRFVGTLTLSDIDGASSERRIDAQRCDEVVRALALVAALAIDPEASTASRTEPSHPERRHPLGATPPKPPAQSPDRAELRLGAGAVAGVVRGPAPEPLAVAGPVVDLSRTGGAWAPAARFAALAGATGVIGPSAERASFRFFVVRSELTPQLISIGSRLRLRAGGLLDAGLLYARGDARSISAQSATRPWLSLGLALGADFSLTRRISLSFSVAEALNLTRDDFVFENPDELVHDVPLASQSAFIGVSLRVL